MPEQPFKFSYSALSSYQQCGKRYELERIRKVPEIPSWWFVGGRAVHAATELWDIDEFGPNDVASQWQRIFHKEIEAQKERFPDVSKWRTAGRRSKKNPDGEDYLKWMELGPEFVQNYITWRQATNWEILRLVSPEGKEFYGIELELEVSVGRGLLRGSIDRVFIHPNGDDLAVVDIKTGTRTPDSDLQLGTYAAGMELQFGLRPRFGMYFMARRGEPSNMYELGTYRAKYLAGMADQLRAAVGQGVFLPHKSILCNYCPVNHGCVTFGGSEAHLYDTMSPGFEGANNGHG